MTPRTLATLAAAEIPDFNEPVSRHWLIRRELELLLMANLSDRGLLAQRYEGMHTLASAAKDWGCTEAYLLRRWHGLYKRLSERLGFIVWPPDLQERHDPFAAFRQAAREWDAGWDDLRATVARFAESALRT